MDDSPKSTSPPQSDLDEIRAWGERSSSLFVIKELHDAIEISTSYGRPVTRLKYNAGWRMYYPSENQSSWTPFDDFVYTKPPLDILENHPGGLAGAPPATEEDE